MGAQDQPLGVGQWAARAVGVGAVMMVLGWLSGGVVALLLGPMLGVVAGVVAGLGMMAWGSARVGSAGVIAGLLVGMVAAVCAGLEVPRAWHAARVTIVEAPALTSWPEGARALRLPPLTRLPKHHGSYAWTTRSSTKTGGSTTTHHYREALPLADARGRVVGFECHAQRTHKLKLARQGSVVVPYGPWQLHTPEDCAPAVAQARERLDKARVELAPGASTRLVVLFEDEQSLRRAGRLDMVFGMPGVFLILYTVGVLLSALGMALRARL